MSLQILSTSLDPQSPFPYTPSNIGESPPTQYFKTLHPSPSRHAKEPSRSVAIPSGQAATSLTPPSTADGPSSAGASPRTPSSIASPCLTSSSAAESPSLLASSLSSSLRLATVTRSLPSHPTSASIPILLDGLGVDGSPETTASQSSSPGDRLANGLSPQRGSIGLGILQEAHLSLSTPTRGEIAYDADLSMSSVSSGDTAVGTTEAVPMSRDERVGSWQSDMLSVGGSASSGATSTLVTPEPSPRTDLFSSKKELLVDLTSAELAQNPGVIAARQEPAGDPRILKQETKDKSRTVSIQSDFSISAYTYSPALSSNFDAFEGRRWRMASGESRVALLRKSEDSKRPSPMLPPLPVTAPSPPPPVPPKQKRLSPTALPKQRRRAVTISAPQDSQSDELQVRRQSSPPSSSVAQFGSGFSGTLTYRQRALFGLDPRSGKQTRRPRTSGNTYEVQLPVNARLAKPLPIVPGFRSASSPYTPARQQVVRPNTGASPAARTWGLVSSASAADYKSLRSRDSMSSSIEESSLKSPTAASFTSSLSSGSLQLSRPESLTLSIDQESFREVRPVFIFSFFDAAAGHIEWKPREPMASYPFHYGSMEAAPTLRRLVLPGYEDREFLSKQATLPIKHEGVYAVAGVEGKGRWTWKFTYYITDRVSLMGKVLQGEKRFVPLSFCCEPQILDPAHSRKRKVLSTVYKTLASKLEAARISGLPDDFARSYG